MTGIWYRFFQKRLKLTNTYDVFLSKNVFIIQVQLIKKEYIASLSVAQVTVNVGAFFSTCLRSKAFHGHV